MSASSACSAAMPSSASAMIRSSGHSVESCSRSCSRRTSSSSAMIARGLGSGSRHAVIPPSRWRRRGFSGSSSKLAVGAIRALQPATDAFDFVSGGLVRQTSPRKRELRAFPRWRALRRARPHRCPSHFDHVARALRSKAATPSAETPPETSGLGTSNAKSSRPCARMRSMLRYACTQPNLLPQRGTACPHLR